MFNKTSRLPELPPAVAKANTGSFTTEEMTRTKIISTTERSMKLTPRKSLRAKKVPQDSIKQEISFALFNSAKYNLDKTVK